MEVSSAVVVSHGKCVCVITEDDIIPRMSLNQLFMRIESEFNWQTEEINGLFYRLFY